ncbi:hypothetical protein Q1695_007184 [Nippostrongylus brasiliensis]|nr:hypothetical protein Q1695_007184 [Nippostrongylus brasiliensis]
MLALATVFCVRVTMISYALLDVYFYNISPPKQGSSEGSHDRLQQIRSGYYDTAPFNRSKLLPPFFNYKEKFHIVPNYHILMCRIEKVMVTLSDAIFCYLTNHTEFNANNRRISTENFDNRFCDLQNFANSLTSALGAVNPPRIQFVLVRHPIDRFLSGFVNKCIIEGRTYVTTCFECKGDMSCFVQQLTIHLRQIYEMKENRTYMGVHFAPQSWYCHFNKSIDHLRIIKYSSGREGAVYLAAVFDNILREAGVPKCFRNEIRKEMLVGHTQHSTYGGEERRKAELTLMSNVTLLAEVVRLYYYDFVLFDFDIPHVFR